MVAGMVAMVVAVVLVMGLAGVAVAPIHEGVKHHGLRRRRWWWWWRFGCGRLVGVLDMVLDVVFWFWILVWWWILVLFLGGLECPSLLLVLVTAGSGGGAGAGGWQVGRLDG